jgi:DNA-binding response OmpR family regulator
MMDKIALIEDDAVMLSLLHTLMELEGYSAAPIRGNTVEDLYLRLAEEAPSAALIDVHVFQINGIDLLKKIRQSDQLKNLPVIMSSGMDYSNQCFEAGADHFILKPYMPDDLIKLVRKSLDEKRI